MYFCKYIIYVYTCISLNNTTLIANSITIIMTFSIIILINYIGIINLVFKIYLYIIKLTVTTVIMSNITGSIEK